MSSWILDVRRRLQAEFAGNPWLCVMATTSSDGSPTARCMVCREIDRDGRLLFVSDRRTRKDDHLRNNPACEICFWLPTERVQVRLGGRVTVMDAETDTFLRQTWWDRLPSENRQIFGAAAYDVDPPMPVTFELLTLAPDRVEVQDLKLKANQKQVWTIDQTEWQAVGVM